MSHLLKLPAEILQHIVELMSLQDYGSLLSTSRTLFQQLDAEEFWFYLTSQHYSTEVSPLVLAPALDLHYIDLHNRKKRQNLNLLSAPPLWKYIFRIYFYYTGPVIGINNISKFPRIVEPEIRHKQYEYRYCFMTRLIDKMIAKWPWLYSTYSEKDNGLREPYYNKKVEIGGPIGRFITGTLYGQGGLYRTCTVLDVAFNSEIPHTVSLNFYTLMDERGMAFRDSTSYTFPSLSLSSLSLSVPYFNEFSQKCETIVTMFLSHCFYMQARPWGLGYSYPRPWISYNFNFSGVQNLQNYKFADKKQCYSFSNEQKHYGELLEKKINRYAEEVVKQLELYIKPLDYVKRTKIIRFLDNPETSSPSKTLYVAIMRCIRRRLKVFLKPLQYIFEPYQKDDVLKKLISTYQRYEVKEQGREVRYEPSTSKSKSYYWAWPSVSHNYPSLSHREFNIIKNNGYWSLFWEWGDKSLKESHWKWSVGLQGMALEIIEPLSKYVGLDILENCEKMNEIALVEKIKEKKKLNLRQIETVVEKYNISQCPSNEVGRIAKIEQPPK